MPALYLRKVEKASMIMSPTEPLTKTVGSISFLLLFSTFTGIKKKPENSFSIQKKKKKEIQESLATVI